MGEREKRRCVVLTDLNGRGVSQVRPDTIKVFLGGAEGEVGGPGVAGVYAEGGMG